MPAQHVSHAAFGRQPKFAFIEPDAPVQWGCSLKGWNCCVDKGITVRPYDMVRLRHAAGRPAQELTASNTVTFAWHPPTGALVGSLAHKPYTPGHIACTFFEEVTNVSARQLRETDPEAFRALPERVRVAADTPAKEEYRVAGLCSAHLNRPEVCRAFPYQRQVGLVHPDGTTEDVQMRRVNLCGSCALSTPTTPRAVAESEDLGEYWRANDAFAIVMSYYRSRGASKMGHAGYRALPLSDVDLMQLWAAMYLPDIDPVIRDRCGEQWRTTLDTEGDREVYRLLMQRAVDRLDALIAQRGFDIDALGTLGAEKVGPPDIDRLLDPAREVLPSAEATIGVASSDTEPDAA